MTTRLPNAVGVWREAPGAGIASALSVLVWAYDVATSTWSLTTDRRAEAGRFTDLPGTRTFTLEFIDTIPLGATTLAQARRADDTVLFY